MPYLRVDCYICGACWNYHEEKCQYPPMLTTAVQYQACVCPNCGNLGVIASGVDINANPKQGEEDKATNSTRHL